MDTKKDLETRITVLEKTLETLLIALHYPKPIITVAGGEYKVSFYEYT